MGACSGLLCCFKVLKHMRILLWPSTPDQRAPVSLQASVLDKSEHLAYQHSVHQSWLPPTGELIESSSPWSKNKNCQQTILSRHPFSALLTVKHIASRDILLIFRRSRIASCIKGLFVTCTLLANVWFWLTARRSEKLVSRRRITSWAACL